MLYQVKASDNPTRLRETVGGLKKIMRRRKVERVLEKSPFTVKWIKSFLEINTLK
jgi:hypothetical protein